MSDRTRPRERGTSEEYSHSDSNLKPWKNTETLRELYHGQGLSQYDIADRFDITQQTVSYWFDKFKIETRSPTRSISRSIREDGKVKYKIPDDGDWARFYRHQLVALLEFDASEVFADDTHVHHEMGAPVAVDIPENLDVLVDVDHIRLHAGSGKATHPEAVLGELYDEYEGEPDPGALSNPLAASMSNDLQTSGRIRVRKLRRARRASQANGWTAGN